MPDDLDDMLRGAMKVLDEQTPSGYFDAVPNRILARLEDGTMQHGSGTTNMPDKRDALMGPPVVAEDLDTKPTPKVAEDREEDSGLHDIRNLAQSTKQRLSSRRITAAPPISDEDALASASGSWKNIALPQPAKMVALPDLEDLPSKQEVLAAQKAAKQRKVKASSPPPATETPVETAPAAAVAAAPAAAVATEAPVTTKSESVATRAAFSVPSMERRTQKSKGPLFAVVGLGVAAAAAGAFFMTQNKDSKPTAAPVVAKADTTPVKAPTVEPLPPAPTPAPVVEAVAPAAAPAPVEEPKDAEAKATGKHAAKATAPTKKADVVADKTETKPETKAAPDTEKKKGGAGEEGEPSFDALLKEAGVDDSKKEKKPVLDKKALSSDDFKQGMGAVNTAAKGCYKGTQGIASVKLSISPAGKVTKATVTGAFAGKPEAACVEAAVKGATFPAWDGAPQSMNYSYMLSD